MKNVKNPRQVKELIHKNVEEAKNRRRMRATELLGQEDGPSHLDGENFDFDGDGCDAD